MFSKEPALFELNALLATPRCVANSEQIDERIRELFRALIEGLERTEELLKTSIDNFNYIHEQYKRVSRIAGIK